MTRGRKNKKQGDLFEPIVNHSIQHVWLEHPVPDKLFFLATGEGCGTVEVNQINHVVYLTSLAFSLFGSVRLQDIS